MKFTATPSERDTMTATTTSASEQIARDRLSGDWDSEGTISVHLPTDVAERLLVERGWTPRPISAANRNLSSAWSGATHDGWISPAGVTFWCTDEALQIALVAENS
jgi:hypothetical protein